MKKNLNHLLIILILLININCTKPDTIEDIQPELKMIGFSDLTTNSVVLTSEILVLGNMEIIQHGHCWSTNANPDINSPHSELGKATISGLFISNVNNLNKGTIYFAKAYISTDKGVYYSEPISFPTATDGDSGGSGK